MTPFLVCEDFPVGSVILSKFSCGFCVYGKVLAHLSRKTTLTEKRIREIISIHFPSMDPKNLSENIPVLIKRSYNSDWDQVLIFLSSREVLFIPEPFLCFYVNDIELSFSC